MAVASPAVCALRAMCAAMGPVAVGADPDFRDASGRIAFGFRTLFNLPDVSSSLRTSADTTPYWLTVLW